MLPLVFTAMQAAGIDSRMQMTQRQRQWKWHGMAETSLCCVQHSSLSLLKEMLVTLDLAKQTGSPADKRAADRLSRR